MSSLHADLRGQSSLTAKQGAGGSNLFHQQSHTVYPCHKTTESSSAPGMQTFKPSVSNSEQSREKKKKKKQIPPLLLTSSSHNLS